VGFVEKGSYGTQTAVSVNRCVEAENCSFKQVSHE